MNSWAAAIRAARSICSRVASRVAEGDVRGDGVAEQKALLKHQPDVAPQVVEVQLAHVDAVDQHAAARSSRKTAASRLSSVLLPAPVSPTIATHCPGSHRQSSDRLEHRLARRS